MKIRIIEESSKDKKEKITLDTMNSLPECFSLPEDIVKKAITHREYPFFTAYWNEGNPYLFLVKNI